jgi:LPXTG-motif cell wall-anchored protein
MRKITAMTIGALLALLPAGAFADETPTDTLTQAVAPAPAPAASSSEEQAAPEPAATPAQDDVSGGNEYSEEVPPTGTGDPDDTPDTSDDTNDTTTSQPAPTGGGTTSGSDVAATEATETGAEEGGLPRTGADSWLIALIGIAFLGGGILVRRAALPQR